MTDSRHVRRLTRYCLVCLRGTETTPIRWSVNAYDGAHAYDIARRHGLTPTGILTVN